MPHFPTEMGAFCASVTAEMDCTPLFPGPLMTRLWLILALAVAPGVTQAAATGDSAATVSFQSFVDELWPQVQSRGVSRATFDSTFAGVTPDPRVLAATRRQPEYAKPFRTYINAFVSQERIAAGRRNAQRWNDTLAAVETTYGVDRSIILSIWGAESDYGAADSPRGSHIPRLDGGFLGGRDGAMSIFAVELPAVGGGFFWRRTARHLDQRFGCPRVDCSLSAWARLHPRTVAAT